MTKLIAPTADKFLAALNRVSVPLSVVIDGHWRQVPSEAWERVFNGPHDSAGAPTSYGGLTAATVSRMKKHCIKNQPHDALRRTADASAAPAHLMTSHSKPAVSLPTTKTLHDSAPATMSTEKGATQC